MLRGEPRVAVPCYRYSGFVAPTSGGPENDFTNRNITFMTWNLLHAARMLRNLGGFPAHGNQADRWAQGEHVGTPNPEYR